MVAKRVIALRTYVIADIEAHIQRPFVSQSVEDWSGIRNVPGSIPGAVHPDLGFQCLSQSHQIYNGMLL